MKMGLACEQALGGAMAARGEGGRACNFALEFEFHLQFQGCGSPSTELSDFSASQREAETNWNVNKHRKTRAMGNDVITKADISPS